MPGSIGSRWHEREFLPAALEIIETPASPAGRSIGAAIIALMLLAMAWAVFGQINIYATAPGKIVPTGRIKTIQPLESGIVRAIHVEDGQAVKAGETLIELDPTKSLAERNRLASELMSTRLEVARLEALLSDAADPSAAFVAPEDAEPAQIALMRRLIQSASAEFRAKLAGLDGQVAQSQANRAAIAATVEKLDALIPLLQQQAELRRTLLHNEFGSKLAYIDAEQQLVASERELVVQQRRLVEADAALAAVTEQRREAEAGERRSRLAALAEARAKAEAVAQDLVKAEQHIQEQTLTAPVNGIVQQLAIHTVGGVVTPAQTLLELVPTDRRVEIEASIANGDIGFVHAGQPAEIKIDTFAFTRYGLVPGKVLSISPDATPPTTAIAEGTDKATAREPGFTARISLDRDAMQIDDQLVPLRPGMGVTVEIDTGKRRVIEYLLSPLLRYSHDSMRER